MNVQTAFHTRDKAAQCAAEWIESHADTVRPLSVAANLAAWEAATTGDEQALRRSADAKIALRRVYSDPTEAARVREMLASADLDDELLRRQLVVCDLAFTANQLDAATLEDLSQREAELERAYYTHRARLDGREASDNELLEILRTERDSHRRREVWEASKQLAGVVSEPLRELVRRRNAAARSLGFANYYSMELTLQEIDEKELFSLLEEFRALTDEPFALLRREMDRSLAERYGIAPDQLRPWHWEDFFGQEAPSLGMVDLDPIFRGTDLVGIAARYFDTIGLPVDDVLARSDLYERERKDQHAFCTDIDREGDVRVLCNLRDNEKWMGTLLHELGHAAYDKFIPSSLPFLVRMPAHTLSTEAIAMLMGRLTRNPEWLQRVMGAGLGEAERQDIRKQQKMSMLVSSRWILVMSFFERELYRDPDNPDLNSVWWDLVEAIQLVLRPEGRDAPDWAAKIHLSLAPVYYHNYLLGELMASQLDGAIGRNLPSSGSAIGNPAVGAFLRERVFGLGATLPWTDLLVSATGERLSARYFAEQFVSR